VDGGFVRLRTRAGEAVLPVRVSEHVAPGAVFVPFNQPGLAANGLLSGRFTSAVELEAATAADVEPPDLRDVDAEPAVAATAGGV
jgi:predicted molibdopterin-dependent oxidoreductase YjgC